MRWRSDFEHSFGFTCETTPATEDMEVPWPFH
jgi:hypothetical protein